MVFSSLIFICIFLPITLITYNISKSILYKNIVLAAASLFFYAWGEPVWVILLIGSALSTYLHGLIIDKYYGTLKASFAAVSSVVISLSLLAVFKYLDFIISGINLIPFFSIKSTGLSLPIGISFYTFQTLSYTLDLYNGKTHVQKSYMRFLLYVSMFPQLIAGPIVRYDDIADELAARSVTLNDFAHGIERFVIGLLKKVFLANGAGVIVPQLLSATHPTAASAWLGICLYAFQIYFDFSGYSDMAIGMGSMFGFHLKENFDYPYISRNITEFWRRWHISLSSFFRDYVYIPLGGNRSHSVRNLLIVWMLTGLWHGASLNFVLWGVWYGLILIMEKYIFRGALKKLPSPFNRLYSLLVILMGWAIFYFTDFGELAEFFKTAFCVGVPLYSLTAASVFLNNLWFILICVAACTPIPSIILRRLCKNRIFGTVAEPAMTALGLALGIVLIVGQSYNPFLYFRF